MYTVHMIHVYIICVGQGGAEISSILMESPFARLEARFKDRDPAA
jgi:hypothetical protein